jgi:hypothetical protein
MFRKETDLLTPVISEHLTLLLQMQVATEMSWHLPITASFSARSPLSY